MIIHVADLPEHMGTTGRGRIIECFEEHLKEFVSALLPAEVRQCVETGLLYQQFYGSCTNAIDAFDNE